jgi:dienelactone hydrolase
MASLPVVPSQPMLLSGYLPPASADQTCGLTEAFRRRVSTISSGSKPQSWVSTYVRIEVTILVVSVNASLPFSVKGYLNKICIGLITVELLRSVATAQPGYIAGESPEYRAKWKADYHAMPNTAGSGPYPARMESDPSLPNYTIYRPINLRGLGSKKLGLLIWGNGGCSDDGSSARLHLAEIASHGYLAIAPGTIMSGPSAGPTPPPDRFMKTTADDLRFALNWALAENERRGSAYFRKIDPRLAAVSGHSCGGMQAILIAADPRIKAIVLHNSGVFPNMQEKAGMDIDKTKLNALHTPVLYIVGNQTDIAWEVAKEDFAYIKQVPVMLAMKRDAGHQGSFAEPNGGAAARVAIDWLEWQLREDQRAAHTFTGRDCGLCVSAAWSVQRKGMD